MKDYCLKPDCKKIRGWKRRIKHLNNWGNSILSPDMEYFAKRGFTYDRCTISPFYRQLKRKPSIWFYKLIIAKFLTAYDNWLKVFDDLGQPYDLMVWIYDPSFPRSEIIRSEIICYSVEGKNQKMHFCWESDLEKTFPYKLLASPAYDLESFNWILANEENIIFQDDIDHDELNVNELIADGYIKKTQNGNQIYYAKRIGDIWVGRRRTS